MIRMVEIELGSETDDQLIDRIRSVVISFGGTITELSRNVVGSQEISGYQIQLPTGILELTAETYIGLILRGPEQLVCQIADAVKSA